jgi:hypothetical protein
MADLAAANGGETFGEFAGRAVAWCYTFGFSAVATFLIALNTYSEKLQLAPLAACLFGLLLIQALAFRRIALTRELGLYTCFFLYMLLELAWTKDVGLAVNTLAPAFNFVLIVIIFSTLVTYHNIKPILIGALAGLIVGAIGLTLTQGFPFSIPPDFSYNAIAGMYLFGLVVAVMLSCYSRAPLILVPIQLVLMLLIVATTSIKTNLGIVLGLIAACLFYFRLFFGVLRRHFLLLSILIGALVVGLVSNEQAVERLATGFSRVSVGVSVLQAREDQPGYTGFEYRSVWKAQGLNGWLQNPVFGYGPEAFRSDFGITSHSTPIDLLYNTGLIGIGLFYALFLSIALRLLRARATGIGPIAAVIFGSLVCYAFITLSATMHYNSFLAAFFGLSSQILALVTRAPVRTAAA